MIIETVDELYTVAAVPAHIEISVRRGSSRYVHIRRLFAYSWIQGDQRAQSAVEHRQFPHFLILQIGRCHRVSDLHQWRLARHLDHLCRPSDSQGEIERQCGIRDQRYSFP